MQILIQTLTVFSVLWFVTATLSIIAHFRSSSESISYGYMLSYYLVISFLAVRIYPFALDHIYIILSIFGAIVLFFGIIFLLRNSK